MKTAYRAILVLALLTAAPAGAAEEAKPAAAAPAAAPAAAAPAAAPAVDSALDEGKAPEVAPAAAPAAPAAPAPEAAQVVEGAPLGNRNVHVHIVEKKPYTNEGRHEIALYPAVAQINSKFTSHLGVAGMYSYHLFENLALQVTPLFNYVNSESSFHEELIDKGQQQAQAATALLLQYGGVAGMEVTPMYGKFAFYDSILGHFTFVLNAGAGVGMTRIQLRPAQTANCGGDTGIACREAAFGDIGPKFVGSVGAGFRVFLGERAAVRLEVRDLIYTARVDQINGCTYRELADIGNGIPLDQGSSCQTGGVFQDAQNVTLAKKLLEETSSDVLNNLSAYAGFSVLF